MNQNWVNPHGLRLIFYLHILSLFLLNPTKIEKKTTTLDSILRNRAQFHKVRLDQREGQHAGQKNQESHRVDQLNKTYDLSFLFQQESQHLNFLNMLQNSFCQNHIFE